MCSKKVIFLFVIVTLGLPLGSELNAGIANDQERLAASKKDMLLGHASPQLSPFSEKASTSPRLSAVQTWGSVAADYKKSNLKTSDLIAVLQAAGLSSNEIAVVLKAGGFTDQEITAAMAPLTSGAQQQAATTPKTKTATGQQQAASTQSTQAAGGQQTTTAQRAQTIAGLWQSSWDTLYASDLAALVDPATGNISSEALMGAAWKALNSGDKQKAMYFAFKTIHLYSSEAAKQQLNPSATPQNNWALNDVATAYFIISQATTGEISHSALGVILDSFDKAHAVGSSGQWEPLAGWATDLLTKAGIAIPKGGTGTGTTSYDNAGKPIQKTNTGENGTVISITMFDEYGRAQTTFNHKGEVIQRYEYNAQGFLHRTVNIGQNGAILGWTTFNEFGRAASSFNEKGKKTSDYIYNSSGFLEKTRNYGDNETFIGETHFDQYGRAKETFNEHGKLTTQYIYSAAGFLKEAHTYGIDGTYQGKTTFDVYGRADQSFNAQGSMVQQMHYSAEGFISTSTNYGENGAVVGTTYYNELGKQSHVTNKEGHVTTRFEYNANGFLSRSVNYSNDANGAVQTGYTTYDAAGRAQSSYATYDNGTDGPQSYKTADFHYRDGFATGTTNYTADENGNSVENGRTTFDRYGRPTETFNDKGALVSRNVYSAQGFIKETHNFGEGQRYLGKTTFDDTGRAVASFNNAGAKTTDYFYNSYGNISHTIGYGDNQTPTSRTTFNVYGKPEETYQLYGSNYSNGGATGGALVGRNHYDKFGIMTRSESFGRTGKLVSTTYFDRHGRATETKNHLGAVMQQYNYSPAGFLQSTTSFYVQDENGEYTIQKTSTTEYNALGQQTRTLNEEGSVVATYTYNSQGFMSRADSWNDGTRTGHTVYDATGRATLGYNAQGTLTSQNNYNTDGFLVSITGFGDGTNNNTGNQGAGQTQTQASQTQGTSTTQGGVGSATATTPSPVQQQVEALYNSVLGRASDPEGLAYYTNMITSGRMTVDQVRLEMRNSPEGRQLSATQQQGQASTPKFDPDNRPRTFNQAQFLQSQQQRSENRLSPAQSLKKPTADPGTTTPAISPASAQRQVEALYNSILGRASDPEGLAYYTNMVTSGRMTVDQVRLEMLRSPERRNMLGL